MTPAQEADSANIRERFNERQDTKYLNGAIEHGGNIWSIPLNKLIDEAEAEHIDGFTYIYHIRLQAEALQAENEQLKERIRELEA
jgi:hypothetical protein